MRKNLKVLVVDDEPDVVEIVSYNLTKAGHQVFRASNGEESLKMAELHRPDLIIMDIRMPGMNGLDACRMMRQDGNLKNIPLLFLTADSDEYTTLNAFDAGATHFITKPVLPHLLTGLIDEIMA
jgi:two-component system, OmpR family, alkaline phosphatase synthesis response regulator PhoP